MNEYRVIIWCNKGAKKGSFTYPVIVIAPDAKSAAEYALERDRTVTSKPLEIESVAIRKNRYTWIDCNF